MRVNVTQPFMPPLDEFYDSLQKIWESKHLTNIGPFHKELEEKLAEYLGVKYLSLFSNGTLALITALQSLDVSGEIITTPYSFVASTHSLWWNGIKPVFVDIDPINFNIDVDKIEKAITPETTAVLPVHVYGSPCNMTKIQEIADKHGLRVIYDAAHAFGVKINDEPILNYGDLSILSFHATKVFNTIEGGAIICKDEASKKKIDYLKNFGFADEVTVVGPGINAKMNELQAAYGLLQLKYIDEQIEKRKELSKIYKTLLSDIEGISFMSDMDNVTQNYSYFPILINSEYGISRDAVYEELKKSDIFSRRYFYPLISHFPPYNELESSSSSNLNVAEEIASKVLCLPIYSELETSTIKFICELLKKIKQT